MKVFLNPGHAPNGNPDPGAVNEETGLRECDVALAVSQSAASYLDAAGVETELLQSDSLYDICEAANNSNANIFVSIHCNAAEAKQANGTAFRRYRITDSRKPPAAENRPDGIL